MPLVVSAELAPPQLSSADGVRKLVSEPVLALITGGEVQDGATLFCDWVFTHPGLVPGPYELVNGLSVVIPPALCTSEGRAVHSVTLEVQA